jgi:ABC-type Mn2+/Zn2+ transport system ATPase subunit
MTASVSTRGLEVRYGDRVALRDVDLDLAAPSSVAVIGPNGSGKSTLLAAIAGIATPSAGSVAVDAPTPPALMLQSTDVDRSLPITVRDAVGLARYPRLGLLRRFTRSDRRAVHDAMARLAVDDLAGQQFHTLSGGQRQRVLAAQVLAQDADILLLDEPVTGLDVVSRTLILEVIDEERSAGRLVVMATHNFEDACRCDLVLLLSTEPVACGPPKAVLSDQHLRRAFGGRFLRLGDEVLLDDPHHH